MVFLLFGGKVIGEFQESIDEFLSREIAHRSGEVSRGLFTRKGRELNHGRPRKSSPFSAKSKMKSQKIVQTNGLRNLTCGPSASRSSSALYPATTPCEKKRHPHGTRKNPSEKNRHDDLPRCFASGQVTLFALPGVLQIPSQRYAETFPERRFILSSTFSTAKGPHPFLCPPRPCD